MINIITLSSFTIAQGNTTFSNSFDTAQSIATTRYLSLLTFPEILANGANVLVSLVAVYALLGLVIGGMSYIMSAGDESRAATGKKTIFYAIIGIVVAGSAEIIMRAIQFGEATPLYTRVLSMTNVLLVPAGVVAFVALLYGGYQYMISGGDESRASKAKHAIFYAILGLLVIGIAGIITNVVIILL